MATEGFIMACEDSLRQEITPLFEHELREFLKAAKSTKAPFKPDLVAEAKRLRTRWTCLNGDMFKRAGLFRQLDVIKQFVFCTLGEDYLNVPYKVPAALLDVFGAQGSVELGTGVLELRLDPRHVQRRFNAALKRDGRPGNDALALARAGKWRELASMLLGDAKLLQSAIAEPVHLLNIHKGLLTFQNRYFKRLVSEDDYELNKDLLVEGELKNGSNDRNKNKDLQGSAAKPGAGSSLLRWMY